jgi:hypothetical protein
MWWQKSNGQSYFSDGVGFRTLFTVFGVGRLQANTRAISGAIRCW